MDEPLPQRCAGVVVVDHDGVPYLETGAGERVCALNESALAIWELCDGSTAPGEMASAIAELCSLDNEQARKDVEHTLDALRDAGVIASTGSHRSHLDGSTTWSRSST